MSNRSSVSTELSEKEHPWALMVENSRDEVGSIVFLRSSRCCIPFPLSTSSFCAGLIQMRWRVCQGFLAWCRLCVYPCVATVTRTIKCYWFVHFPAYFIFFLRHPFVFQATHLAPYATNNDLEIAYCMPCTEHLSP